MWRSDRRIKITIGGRVWGNPYGLKPLISPMLKSEFKIPEAAAKIGTRRINTVANDKFGLLHAYLPDALPNGRGDGGPGNRQAAKRRTIPTCGG